MELDHRGSAAAETEDHSTNTTSSDEMFSFPGTPSSDFEFGCVTPTSPSSASPEKHVSPADQFFLNGRLLPHSFQPTTTHSSRSSISDAPPNFSIRPSSLTTSRTSSIRSSKEDSLMSSRSNSTSSSRSSTATSSCSARTSSSDLSERRAFQSRMLVASRTMSARERTTGGGCGQQKKKIGTTTHDCIKRRGGGGGYCSSHRCRGHGSASQRWQFIISPVPVLDPCSLSRRRRSTSGEQVKVSGLAECGKVTMSPKNKKKGSPNAAASDDICNKDGGKSPTGSSSTSVGERPTAGSWSGFWERTFRSFVKSCKACHAMDQADVDDRDDDLVSCHTEVK